MFNRYGVDKAAKEAAWMVNFGLAYPMLLKFNL